MSPRRGAGKAGAPGVADDRAANDEPARADRAGEDRREERRAGARTRGARARPRGHRGASPAPDRRSRGSGRRGRRSAAQAARPAQTRPVARCRDELDQPKRTRDCFGKCAQRRDDRRPQHERRRHAIPSRVAREQHGHRQQRGDPAGDQRVEAFGRGDERPRRARRRRRGAGDNADHAPTARRLQTTMAAAAASVQIPQFTPAGASNSSAVPIRGQRERGPPQQGDVTHGAEPPAP